MRVLSIQSHVAYGYVGNKAAVFALQLLGYDVDFVNTVNYSNHAGYGKTGGTKTSAADLDAIFRGLESNHLMRPTRLLTGYIPTADALRTISHLVRKLKAQSPGLIYLLDPVVGDSGRPYVPAEVIPIYRELLPQATIITPNWYEVEALTGIPLTDLASLRTALRALHEDYHVPHVVISSIPLSSSLASALPSSIRRASPPSSEKVVYSSTDLLCICSSSISTQQRHVTATNLSEVYVLRIPCIPGYFSGVGDFFSALVLGQFSSLPPPALPSLPGSPSNNLSAATSKALSAMHHILLLTHQYAKALPASEHSSTDDEADKSDTDRVVLRMRSRELRIVQGQDVIRNGGRERQDGELLLGAMKLWDGFWE